MTNVDCPNCNASYPAEKIGARTRFICGRCRKPVEVLRVVEPMASPAAVEPAEELRVVAPIDEGGAPAARPRRAAGKAATKPARTSPAVWIGASAAVCAAIGAGVVWSMNRGAATPAAAPGASAGAAAETKPDPMKDAAAWKALSASEREKLAAQVVAATDLRSAEALTRAAEFFAARGEPATALANRVLERDASSAWARTALGQSEVGAEVDACLKQCEQAEEDDDESFAALKQMRAAHAGSWWADAEAATKVRALVGLVRAAEEGLKTPYGQGIAKWVRWQKKIDVMKEFPSIHAVAGPYVVFVSLDPRSEADRKKEIPLAKEVTLADVPLDRRERGAKILARNQKLYAAYYDGWMQELGPLFGFTRYGPDNAEFATLMKVNVFANSKDFFDYNQRVSAGVGGFTRAYYSAEEPRFVTTYDGGEDEDDAYADQVQCHEGTHQLVHFYTWDLTRKDQHRDIDWLECHWRPLWSGEGFAEFFSSHKVVDGKYQWMQPLDERMRQIWIFEEIVKEKGWLPWRLKEFFTMQHGGQLNSLARARSKKAGDEWIAEGVMGNLFYGKAWSFVYFLWYAEEGGKPKYRDRYVEYLKAEFHVPFVADGRTGKLRPAPAWSGTFARVMKLSTEAQWDALETEWNDFTAKVVAANRKPAWDAERTKSRTIFGMDKPPETKGEKPK